MFFGFLTLTASTPSSAQTAPVIRKYKPSFSRKMIEVTVHICIAAPSQISTHPRI